jgi:hypothetical protein
VSARSRGLIKPERVATGGRGRIKKNISDCHSGVSVILSGEYSGGQEEFQACRFVFAEFVQLRARLAKWRGRMGPRVAALPSTGYRKVV